MLAIPLRNALNTVTEASNRFLRAPPGVTQYRLFAIYSVALLLLCIVYQLSMPIIKTDTDMWYHLNGGRYFWTTGQVPMSSFFSFLEPPRNWSNYFWGFQALVYKVHEIGGYQGLVVFRAAMFFLTALVLHRFIFANNIAKSSPASFLVLLVLMLLLLKGRELAVRPHLFSYLFIPLFYHILQNRPRWAPALPVLAVIWINVHGIEWVVGALVCGAYLIEHLADRACARTGRDPVFHTRGRGRSGPSISPPCLGQGGR